MRIRARLGVSLLLASCGSTTAPDAAVTADTAVDTAVSMDGAGVDAASADTGSDASLDPAETSLRTGQLAAWSFDGDGEDRSGNMLDLDVTRVAFVSARFGMGLDLPFDGAQWAQRPTDDPSLELMTGDFTVSVWTELRAANQTNNQFIVTKGGTTEGWWIGWLSPTWVAGYGEAGLRAPAGTLPVSGFHHLVLERRSGTVTLYADGVAGTPMTVPDNTMPASVALTVGGFVGSGGTVAGLPLDGIVDDLAIWSRALTASERAYLDTHPVPAAQP